MILEQELDIAKVIKRLVYDLTCDRIIGFGYVADFYNTRSSFIRGNFRLSE
jgi:hypothetical protein